MTKVAKILFFLTLTSLLHLGAYFIFRHITQNESELLKDEQHLENIETIDLLIIGDSHAKRCIDENELNNTINCSYYGENPALSYYRLKHIIEDLNIVPQRILIQIDNTRFAKNYLNHYKNKFYYQNFVDINELLELEVISKEEWLEYQLFKVFPQLELVVLSKRLNNNEQKTQKTFASYSENQRYKMAYHFIKGQLIPNGYNDLYDKTSLRYLEKTVSLCQSYDINLVAIKYPVTDYYIDALEHICKKNLKSPTPQEALMQKYDIPIIDLEEEFADQYELFTDSHHMNLTGRKRCTERLKLILGSLHFVNKP